MLVLSKHALTFLHLGKGKCLSFHRTIQRCVSDWYAYLLRELGVGLVLVIKLKVLVAQSCLTLCDPTDYSPLGSSVHGLLQARIQEQVAIPFSRGSFWSKDWTQTSNIAGRFFIIWATREAQVIKLAFDFNHWTIREPWTSRCTSWF